MHEKNNPSEQPHWDFNKIKESRLNQESIPESPVRTLRMKEIVANLNRFVKSELETEVPRKIWEIFKRRFHRFFRQIEINLTFVNNIR